MTLFNSSSQNIIQSLFPSRKIQFYWATMSKMCFLSLFIPMLYFLLELWGSVSAFSWTPIIFLSLLEDFSAHTFSQISDILQESFDWILEFSSLFFDFQFCLQKCFEESKTKIIHFMNSNVSICNLSNCMPGCWKAVRELFELATSRGGTFSWAENLKLRGHRRRMWYRKEQRHYRACSPFSERLTSNFVTDGAGRV